MYRLDHDAVANIFHISAKGFWDVPTAVAFGAACVAKGGAIRLRHGHFAILIDARNFPIQSQAVAHVTGLLLAEARLLTNGPVAFVAGAMLNKLQIDRLFSGERVRSFLDRDQAVAWIDAEWTDRCDA
jgi:hypothetical protein